MTDQRSLDALDVAERYANGDATEAELTAAAAAALNAAAAREAWAAGAAWSTACATAWVATWAAGISRIEMKKKQEVELELRRICGEG